ncbi:MAG: hypothetical protein Q9210_005089 [Variospora velana]
MPFIPHTPESLIPRSDSKNAASTCKGITSGGRPCRRALNTRKGGDGVLAVVANDHAGDDGAAAFFCWQHKEQAAEFVSDSQAPGAAHLYPLQERTSTDTLAERLGFLDIEDRQGQRTKHSRKRQPKAANKEGLPQKWQEIPGPLLAVSTLEKPTSHQPLRTRRPHPLLSFLCCGASDEVAPGPSKPAVPLHKATATPSSFSQTQHTSLPSQVRYTEKSSHRSQHRRPSSARPALADKCTNPAIRPSLPRDPSSQTENLLAWIPKTLSPKTTSQLLAELAKPVSEHDEEGYIYIFWLTTSTDAAATAANPSAMLTASPLPSPRSRRASSAPRDSSSSSPQANNDPSPSNNILLKIGRASNVQRRMNEWTRQCGYSLTLIRYYPYLPSSTPSSSSTAQPRQASPRKVPHAHRVERLIHLELAEKRVQRDCDVCGKEHREWFEVSGDRQGVKGVDEVVRRWVRWAEGRR